MVVVVVAVGFVAADLAAGSVAAPAAEGPAVDQRWQLVAAAADP